MDGKLIQFVNCKILRNHSIYEDIFLVCGGKIIDPEKVFFEGKRKPDIIIDLKGCIVSPGFIDIQINGIIIFINVYISKRSLLMSLLFIDTQCSFI